MNKITLTSDNIQSEIARMLDAVPPAIKYSLKHKLAIGMNNDMRLLLLLSFGKNYRCPEKKGDQLMFNGLPVFLIPELPDNWMIIDTEEKIKTLFLNHERIRNTRFPWSD